MADDIGDRRVVTEFADRRRGTGEDCVHAAEKLLAQIGSGVSRRGSTMSATVIISVVDAGDQVDPRRLEERAHRRCLARVHPRRPEVDRQAASVTVWGRPPMGHALRAPSPARRSLQRRAATKPDTPAPMTKTDRPDRPPQPGSPAADRRRARRRLRAGRGDTRGVAALLGRYDEAETHSRSALDMSERMRAEYWIARTALDLAELCIAGQGSSDIEAANDFVQPARRTTRTTRLRRTPPAGWSSFCARSSCVSRSTNT